MTIHMNTKRRILSAMLSFLLFILSTANGATLYTGVPVNGLVGLGQPRFQTVDTGWMATVPNGYVRVFVGPSAADAERWVKHRVADLAAINPQPNEGFAASIRVDEAHGDGVGTLIFRSKNVAVSSRSKVNATEWASKLLHAIVIAPHPWPSPPVLSIKGKHWVIEAPPESLHVSYVGGITVDSPSLRFVQPPYRIISWDSWGRAAWTEVSLP